jgi:hypothetical protein
MSGPDLTRREKELLKGLEICGVNGAGSPDGAQLVPFAGIRRERVRWLWPGRIPLGMLTLLVGDPGLGKSILTCSLAAQVSRAGADALLVSAEDSHGATVRPRLEAAGADLDRVHALEVRRDGVEDGLALPDDAAELEELVRAKSIRLVVVDPLMAHLPERVNSWRDQSVRRALAPLHRLAAAHGCAVVVVAHLNKSNGRDALHRTGGSIGIPAAVRSALLLARDPEDPEGDRGVQRVLAHAKCNVGPQAASLAVRIEPVLLPGEERIDTARVQIIGECEATASQLLDAPIVGEERTAVDEAVDFLRGELAEGPVDTKEVQSAARAAGISDRTLDRARYALGVKADRLGEPGKRGGGHWIWRLPVKSATIKGAIPISDPWQSKPNPLVERDSDPPEPLRTPTRGDGDLELATPEQEAEAARIAAKFGGLA